MKRENKRQFVEFMLSGAGRLLRIVAGSVIIALALRSPRGPAWRILGVLGLVPILAGLFNFCLLGPLFDADLQGRPKDA